MDNNILTSDDPLYDRLFDVKKEAQEGGGGIYGDLSPAMNALRDKAPVQKGTLRELLNIPDLHNSYSVERETYTLFSFELCDRALRENQVFSSLGYLDNPSIMSMGKVILKMVGDEHRRYRSVLQPMFIKPRAIDWWQPNWIQTVVDALLDRIDQKGDSADLNMDLCARLPVNVVTRGIGMDEKNALEFREHLYHSTIAARNVSEEVRVHASNEVTRMLKELITERRAHPADDVISGMISNDLPLEDGSTRKLTDEEIFSQIRLIMLAGGGTTWRQLGITLHTLLTNYHFWEACRDNRKLIGPAIEEAARWLPTDPVFARVMYEDVELEGVKLPKGARINMCFGSANRDPARWDRPDEFDILRPYKAHLGFGMGPHRCLGIDIAKQEMSCAINGLMDRYPNLRLNPNVPTPELLGGVEQRGMSSVPVLLQ